MVVIWVTNALTMLLPLALLGSSLAITSPLAGFVITLTLLFGLMAVTTSARSLNDGNTFEQRLRCLIRTGFSIGSRHRVHCVLECFICVHVMCSLCSQVFVWVIAFATSDGPTPFIHVYRIEYRRLLRAQHVESSIGTAFPRACELCCRLLPRGLRPGQDRTVLSLCSWLTLLQGGGARLCTMIHWTPLPLVFLLGAAPLPPLWHRRAAVQSRLSYLSACNKISVYATGWSLRSTFTYRQLLNGWYSFAAPGTRLPNRKPVTVYFWYLPFFASLVAGLPAGLVAASSAKSSWAARLARAVSNTPVLVTRLLLLVNLTSWSRCFYTHELNDSRRSSRYKILSCPQCR